MPNNVELQIVAKNLTQDAFNQVATQLKTLDDQTRTTTGSMSAGFSSAGKSVGELEAATDHWGQSFESLAARLTERFAIYEVLRESLASIKDLVGGSIEAYSEASQQAQRLTVALQTQGLAIPGLNQQYRDLAQRYQETTAYSHTAIEAAEALFVQLGNVGPDMMDRALKAATDLSSGLGIDLNSAVELLSRAAEGQTAAFTRYGIVLDQARVKSEGFGYVLDAVESKVGGQAQGELDTYAGKVKQLGNAWDDVKEAIGKAIVSDGLVEESVQHLTDKLKDHSSQTDAATESWAHYLAGLIPVVDEIVLLDKVASAQRDLDSAFKGAQGAIPALPSTLPSSTFFKDQASHASDVVQQTLDALDKQKKADADAQKAFDDAVKSMADAISGADLAKKVKEMSAAVAELGGTSKLTQPELDRLTKQADTLVKEGAQLPPAILQATHAFDALLPPVKDGADGITHFGEAIKLTLPQATLLQAVIDSLDDKTKIGFGGLGEIGVKVSSGFGEAVKSAGALRKEAEQTDEAFRQLASTVDTLGSVIGGGLGTAVSDVGHLVTAVEEADKAFQAMAEAKNILSGIASGLTGIIGLVSAAIGPVESLFNHFFGTAGRDAVKSFADSMGGFDALHQELLDKLTNGVGEQFWIKLTQDIGRNDKASADALIAQIQQALANSPAQQASDAGYQTVDELQAAATKAVQLWQYMRDSGTYTASEVADAWSKAEAAMSAAGEGALSDLEQAKTAAQQQLDAMNTQIQSLQQSIAQEAPEEVEGVIEQQQRAQLASLQAQAAAQQQHVDDLNQQIQDAANDAVSSARDAAIQAGTDTVDAIQDALDHADLRVKVFLDTDGSATVPGHADGAYIREDHLAMVHAGEMIGDQTFFGAAFARAMAGRGGGGGGGGETHVHLHLDGRQITSTVVRHMPDELRRFGIRTH